MQGIWKTIRETLAKRVEPRSAGGYAEDLRGLPEHTLRDIDLKESDIVALEIQETARRAGHWMSWG